MLMMAIIAHKLFCVCVNEKTVM